MCCRLLQCVAECCSALQFYLQLRVAFSVAVYAFDFFASELGSVLQSVAMCCRVLQGVTECCSVLQCVAVSCSVLQ